MGVCRGSRRLPTRDTVTSAAVRDLIQLIVVLVLIAAIAAGAVAALRSLRTPQRVVVLIGLIAATAQVVFPPHVEGGRELPRRAEGRRLIDPASSYSPSDIEPWIDGTRQIAGLAVTLM